MEKSKGLEFTKSFNPFPEKGLKKAQGVLQQFGALGSPLLSLVKGTFKSCFCTFSEMNSIFFKPWIFVARPNPYLSLSFAFSSQEQSCSCLRRSECVPCPVCSHVNPCLCPFWAQSFSLPIAAGSACHLLGFRTLLSICPCSRPCWSLSCDAVSGVPMLFPLALEQNVCVLPNLFLLQSASPARQQFWPVPWKQWLVTYPPPIEFVITVFLTFIFHLNRCSFFSPS